MLDLLNNRFIENVFKIIAQIILSTLEKDSVDFNTFCRNLRRSLHQVYIFVLVSNKLTDNSYHFPGAGRK